MGHVEHTTFTAVGFTDEWAADLSAFLLRLEGTRMDTEFHLLEFVSTTDGWNGYTSVTLMPCGGKFGGEFHRHYLELKVRLRDLAKKHKTDWVDIKFGADREGLPRVQTNHFDYGPTCDQHRMVKVEYVDEEVGRYSIDPDRR